MSLLNITGDIILPIVLMAGAGFALQKWQAIDSRHIAKLNLYILSPCLIFTSLVNSSVSVSEMAKIATFNVSSMAVLALIAWIIARLGRYDRPSQSAHLLSSLFMNSGNYGLPVVLLAFGQAGLDRAIIFVAVQSILLNTVAVYIAASSKMGVGQSLRSAAKMPQVYAATLGIILHFSGTAVPTQLATSTKMLGDAAIPTMVLVLGIQLATSMRVANIARVSLATFTRLAISPFVAAAMTALIGMEALTSKVIIVEAAMPTAVAALVLAIEFDAKPEFVSSTVLVSTIASVGTLSVLLTLLAGK